eukprot:scaffold184_cov316-Pinguiococcus_pyrenoidosus.AAC.26
MPPLLFPWLRSISLCFISLQTISELCADAFSGPFSWWQVLQRTAATTRFRAVLSRRLIATQVSPKAGEERLLHALVVATIGAQVVGFVEVGLLPSPLNAPEEVSAEEEAPAADEAASADPGTASLWQEALQSQEDRIRGTPLRKDNVPFLANLVVSRDFRRRGVGRGLVRVCGELVRRRWELPQIFVAVERDNAAAQKLYEEAGFAVVGSGGPIEEDTSAGPRRKRYFSDRVVYMRKELAPLVRNPVVEATETSEEAKEAEETET